MARPNRMSRVAAATSALVVGIESYQITGAGVDLPGSARLAARFAGWLLERDICLPERITLMTAYDEAAYSNGKYGPELSPEDDIKRLREGPGAKVNLLLHANAASDFGEWINGLYAPRERDAFFLLFWVGHGFTYPYLRDRRLCLLGSDANDYQLNHVELADLLDVVGEIAPGIHEAAFVNTCRAPVTDGWERRLQGGWRPVTPPTGRGPSPGGSSPTVKQSIVYAAAHGQTTKMAGWRDRTFADVLLERLDALPHGAGPLAIFDDDLQGFGDQIGWRPYVTTFGYFHDRTERLDTPPQDDRDLTYDEWRNLVEIARSIDGATGPKTRWDVRLGAYCQAVELEHVLGLDAGDAPDRPKPPDTLEELIGALRNRPPRSKALPPPLVVAFEFVAHLPTPSSRPQLAEWCAAWANARDPDGWYRLNNAQGRRPRRLPDHNYLSVLINEMYSPPVGQQMPSRRYRLSALLWAINGPVALKGDGWGAGDGAGETAAGITADEIAGAVNRLIGQAERCQLVPDSDFTQMLVEFVLPRELLGRRLEYEGDTQLGYIYPIVFRDLERLRGLGKSSARNLAEKIQRLIDEFEADDSAPWSARIRWITCADLGSVKLGDISAIVSAEDTFCLALEHGNSGGVPDAGPGAGTPMELIYSLDSGAAIVVSLNYENRCDSCILRPPRDADGSEVRCQMPEEKQLILRSVDNTVRWKGLPDLPYILRDIRPELRQAGLQIGVLMEDKGRLWPSYDQLASGAQAGNN